VRARYAGIAIIVVGVIAYATGFVVDYIFEHETASESTQRWIERSWDASLLLPFVAVAVAAFLWPRWWLVIGIAVVMFLVPIGVYELGIAYGFEEPLDEGCDPCIDTRFLSFMAFPALVIGLVSLAVAAFTRRRGRGSSGTVQPAGTGASSPTQ
jgi:hypothetical protein